MNVILYIYIDLSKRKHEPVNDFHIYTGTQLNPNPGIITWLRDVCSTEKPFHGI